MGGMNSGELEALFARFRTGGDVEALARVFDLTAPELLRVAAHLTRRREDAEDLVQQTFLTAIQRARSFDPDGSLISWLVGILAKHGRNAWRKKQAMARSDLEIQDRRGLMSEVLAREERGAVHAALEGLPEPYREVLVQHLVEGRRGAEIAVLLRRAPDTIRSQIRRGIVLLRKALPKGLIAGGAVAVTKSKGLAGIRAEVLAQAVKPSTLLFGIGGLVMGKKLVAGLVLVTLIGAAVVWGPIRPRPGAEEPEALPARDEPVAMVRAAADSEGTARELLSEPPAGDASRPGEAQDRSTVRVTGQVVDDATGVPVRGAAVWMGYIDFREVLAPSDCSVSGEDGRFEADGNDWRASTVLVWSDNHALLRKALERPPQPDGTMIEIDAGVLRLVPGFRVSGFVRTSEGAAVPDALLLLHERQSTPSFFPADARRVGRTDRNGAFQLEHVPPSEYESHRLFAVSPEGIGMIEIPAGIGSPAAEPVELRLYPPAMLEVSVVDGAGRPLKDAVVEVIPINPPFMLSEWANPILEHVTGFPGSFIPLGEVAEILSLFRTATDPDGHAIFRRLPAPAPCCLRVRKAGHVDHLVRVVRFDASRPTRIRAVLPAIVRRPVAGRVVTLDGQPVAGATVRKFDRQPSRSWTGWEQETESGPDGRFVIEGQDSGSTIHLAAIHPGFARRSRAVPIPVEGDLEPVELIVEPVLPVSGVVLDQYEAPIFGAVVVLSRNSLTVYSESFSTSIDGRFAFPDATEGPWTLSVSLPEPGDQWRERNLVQTITAGTSPIRVVAERETRGRVDVIVEAVDGRTGERLLPTRVSIGRYAEDGKRPGSFQYGQRDDGSRFVFPGLKTGRLCVKVECEGYPVNHEDLELEAGDGTRHLRLAMRGPGRLVGRVLLGDLQMPEGLSVQINVKGTAVDAAGQPIGEGQSAPVGESLKFEFIDVQPGPVTVSLSGSGYIGGSATVDVEHDALSSVEVQAIRYGFVQTSGAGRFAKGRLVVSVTTEDGWQGDLMQWEREAADETYSFNPGRLSYSVRGLVGARSHELLVEQLPELAAGELTVIAGEVVVLEIPPPRDR